MSLPPFIVYALPRSRTFWLSRFLSFPALGGVDGWTCGHDELRHMRSLDDVRTWLNLPATGTVETAAAPWWRTAHEYRPEARVVVVRRPVDEVMHSLLTECGVEFDEGALVRSMKRLDAKLDQIEARVAGCLSVRFRDLQDEEACAAIFEHCLHQPCPHEWWATLAPVHMVINFPAATRYYQAHKVQLDRLARWAKQHTLARLHNRPVSIEGVTFGQEPFDAFLRDGERLIAEHLVQVGEAPEALAGKNLPLLKALDELGVLQVTTARSNGRLFGYSLAIVGPSLEAPDRVEALHTTFYASRDVPGLGLKLQRASVEALRERGVDQAFFRAGVRGDGPRMGTLYRRIGAEPAGEMFAMDLRGAA